MEKYVNAKKFMQYLDDMETMGFNGCAFYGLREYIETNSEDIAPVVHGEWDCKNGVYECTKCGYCFEPEGYLAFFNYCPNCGAKIDGDKNE